MSNVFIPLSLIYNCVAHLWLYLRHGPSWRQNLVSTVLPPPPLSASSRERPTIAIVTGANTGIGFQTAQTLVQDYGYHVILACRSKDKALQAQQSIINNRDNDNSSGRAIVLDAVLDLTDLDSIQKFVKEIKDKYKKGGIDVLINNAGRNSSGELPLRNSAKTSGECLDLMFVSNYLGHFALTKLLLENNLLKGSSSSQTIIVNVSSVMHHFIADDESSMKSSSTPCQLDSEEYWRARAYHQSAKLLPDVYSSTKLAAILHAMELNRRYPGIYAMAVNPGAVNSDIWRGFPQWVRAIFEKVYLTTQQGSVPLVAAAVQRELWKQQNVLYLQPYWRPLSRTTNSAPMLPFTEMLGPYVGYSPTKARLPAADEGANAAKVLWEASDNLLQKVWSVNNENVS
jgi:NAD(P)-dependent dehydrogenase (short-subunit alcohol dehydrogenase family)